MRGTRSVILLFWMYKVHVLMLRTCVCTLYLSAWFSPSFAGYLIGCVESTSVAHTYVCAFSVALSGLYFLAGLLDIRRTCIDTRPRPCITMHILYLYCLDYDLVQVYLLQMCMTHILIMLFCASAHFSPDFLIACQQYLKYSGVFH